MMRHRLWPWTIELDKARDSERHPFSRHIVAVGDLHGDLPNARRVLDFSGVVDEFGDWSGDVDFFVQTGDIIDRFVSTTLKILHFANMIPLEGTTPSIYLTGWIDFAHKQYKLAV
jgi:Calcineurin-like phosphoesterase